MGQIGDKSFPQEETAQKGRLKRPFCAMKCPLSTKANRKQETSEPQLC